MSRRIFLACLALALAFLALAWLTLGDYGITWDEPENFLSGDLYLRFWLSGDPAWLDFEALKNAWANAAERPLFYAYTFARQERYPPVANLVSAFVARILNERLGWADPIVAHHAAIPLFGALGVLAAGLFAGQSRRRLLPALVAAAALALFPLYWNHAHNNVKDVPAAALFIATLWAAWRAFGRRSAARSYDFSRCSADRSNDFSRCPRLQGETTETFGVNWPAGHPSRPPRFPAPAFGSRSARKTTENAEGRQQYAVAFLSTGRSVPSAAFRGFRDPNGSATVSQFTPNVEVVTTKQSPAVSWGWALAAGLLWGLALGTKANALVIPPILAVWGAYLWLWPRVRRRPRGPLECEMDVPSNRIPFVHSWPQFVVGLAVLLIVGLALLVAVWPYLWPDPLRRLYGVVRYFSSVGRGFPVYFEGQLYLAGQTVPWRYALTHVLLTTPLPTLALAVIGLAPALKAAWDGADSAAALLLVALGATLLRASLPGMVIYNGLRQIMEALPLLCILAGFGAQWLWDLLSRRRTAPAPVPTNEGAGTRSRRSFVYSCAIRGWLAWVLLAALLLPQVATLVRLHPYEGAFFNALAGGMARAGERYAPEYWGQSYKEGAAWLNEHAGPGAWVAVPIAGHMARYSLRPDLRLVVTNQVADLAAWTGEGYVMLMHDRDWYGGRATLPAACEEGGVPIHTIQAGKAIILSIYRWPLTS